MQKNIQIVSAPSILGLRPSGVERLSETLLAHGLQGQLGLRDDIVHVPLLNHTYSEVRLNDRAVLNEQQLRTFSIGLYDHVGHSLSEEKFPLILGGDCSILIGVMASLKLRGEFGLIFMDAHADFYLPHQSKTGEAADMDLAIVTGRGSLALTDIHSLCPYVKNQNVFHVAQRDMDEAVLYGCDRLEDHGIHTFNYTTIRTQGHTKIADKMIAQAMQKKLDGYWLHFDADVLSDEVNPAVDYRLPEGLSFDQCEYFLQRFVQSLPIVGLTVTIYNPKLDRDLVVAPHLVSCLVQALH